MRVQAIVVNYRTAALCARSVASILAQGGVDAGITIVDNSEDADEARQLRALASDRVRVLVSERNAGFGAACREAFALDDAPLVLLLNPDAHLLPGALARLVAFMGENPGAGAVSPRAWLDDDCRMLLPPSRLPRPRDLLVDAATDPFPALAHWRSLRHRRCTLRKLRNQAAHAVRSLSGAHVLLRRAAVEASGGLFDPRFFMYFEDSDLCRRLAAAGWGLYVEPSAGAVHHFDQSQSAQADGKASMGAAAERQYMEKYDRGGMWRAAARALRAILPAPAAGGCDRLGTVGQPPAFDVPAPLRGGWVLELSRHPRLRPAAVLFGEGEHAAIPESAWRVLRPATYYCRLGAAGGNDVGPTWCFDRPSPAAA